MRCCQAAVPAAAKQPIGLVSEGNIGSCDLSIDVKTARLFEWQRSRMHHFKIQVLLGPCGHGLWH
jgi:hypothetical protein